MISRAIDSNLLGNGEITTILRKLNQSGGWSQDDVRRLIAGRQALGSRQSAAQTGLFGDAAPMSQAESLVDDIQRGLRDLDPNASQLEYLEGRLQDVADVRRQSMAQLRRDFPEAVGPGRGANRYIRDNVEEGRLAQYDRDMKAINDLGEILDIPENRRLIDSATGSYGYSSIIPGGPQLSRAVTEATDRTRSYLGSRLIIRLMFLQQVNLFLGIQASLNGSWEETLPNLRSS